MINLIFATFDNLAEAVAYDSFYTATDYPVVKVLRESVYAQVQLLGMTDPALTLTLGRCWTTTTPDPESLPQWDLLIDGYALQSRLEPDHPCPTLEALLKGFRA